MLMPLLNIEIDKSKPSMISSSPAHIMSRAGPCIVPGDSSVMGVEVVEVMVLAAMMAWQYSRCRGDEFEVELVVVHFRVMTMILVIDDNGVR